MTENRTYTEADLKAIRKDWEQERTQSELAKQVAAIQGQLLALPQMMEAVARRVVAEVIADQHRQATDRAWGRAPALMQAVYLMMSLGAVVAAWLAGRGHFP